MPFGQQARYNGNHNNLLLSLGRITEEEKAFIQKTALPTSGRPYLILQILKINAPQWVTFDQIYEVNPQKFSGEYRRKFRMEQNYNRLTSLGLAEQHPDKPDTIRITPLGIKYLYNKNLVRTSRKRKKEE